MNFDFFTAQPPFHIVKIVPEFPVQYGSDFWVSLNRGNEDVLASHDLEDIINVIDGRVELLDEIAIETPELAPTSASAVPTCLPNRISPIICRACWPRMKPWRNASRQRYPASRPLLRFPRHERRHPRPHIRQQFILKNRAQTENSSLAFRYACP